MTGRLALLGVALLAAFAIGEAAVRLLLHLGAIGGGGEALFPQVSHAVKFRPSRNPVLRWELDPHDPSTNSHGFRDRERRYEKPPGVARVAVLGDSVTLGRGIPLEQTHPAVLEELLGPGVEVLNFGVGGYNTGQEVEIYARRGRRYDPDLLIVAYVLNDTIPAGAALDAMREEEAPAEPAPPQSRGPGRASGPALAGVLPLVQSELVRLVGKRLSRLGSNSQAPRHPWLGPTYRRAESWRIVSEGFDRLAALAREDGDPVLVVIFPLLTDFDDYEFAWIHAQVREEAERHGFAVLDLLDAFRDHDARDLRLLPNDTVHLGAEGHRIAAAAIRDHLRASGALAALRALADGTTPTP